MSRFWSPTIRSLTPYVPGEQPKLPNLVKLNTNENPYPPSPKAIAAMQEEIGENLRLYPDPEATRLKQTIARQHGISPKNVFVGNGSDEVLAHVFLGLLRHQAPILFPDITYSFYPVYCGLYEIGYQSIPLRDDFSLCIDDYLSHGRTASGIIFPNPNAPTGRLVPVAAIEKLAVGCPDTLLVVDEAYIDFSGPTIPSAIPLAAKLPNLLVVQTLSKSRSLAGLRVGFAIGDEALIEGLERVKNSFNSYPLDRIAISGSVAAMEDMDHFNHTRLAVISERQRLSTALSNIGFEVLPSAANFIFVRHPQRDASKLALALRERGIIVRHFKQSRIEQFLRITIGTPSQCEILVQTLHELLDQSEG